MVEEETQLYVQEMLVERGLILFLNRIHLQPGKEFHIESYYSPKIHFENFILNTRQHFCLFVCFVAQKCCCNTAGFNFLMSGETAVHV